MNKNFEELYHLFLVIDLKIFSNIIKNLVSIEVNCFGLRENVNVLNIFQLIYVFGITIF